MKILRWRKMTWAILAWSGLMLTWMIAGTASRPSQDCATDPDVINGVISLHTCQAASDVGTGIGVVLIGFLWFVGFIVLSLVWFMSRPQRVQVVTQP